MSKQYLQGLTREEGLLIASFLDKEARGDKTVTEVEIDEFMRVQNKKFGLFEMCDCRITNKTLIIKRPIGWNT